MATSAHSLEAGPVFCARCAKQLWPGTGNLFQVHIDAIADPGPPQITEEEIGTDLRGHIERLIAQLESVSEREAMDQIHRRLTLYFCNQCFRIWIENPAG